MKSTFAKVAIGFVIGATTVGGVATAGINWGKSVTSACVDNKTGLLYASTGTCAKNRSAVSLGGTPGTINGIVNQVFPTLDRKSTRLNSSHTDISRMPSSA